MSSVGGTKIAGAGRNEAQEQVINSRRKKLQQQLRSNYCLNQPIQRGHRSRRVVRCHRKNSAQKQNEQTEIFHQTRF